MPPIVLPLPLGFYQEKKDDLRQVGLGPEYDWSSHADDGAWAA
jgi:hypothetical protein